MGGKVEKVIEIYSFGEHQVAREQKLPCLLPDANTLQIMLDVRFIPDPKTKFPGIPGTDPKVQEFVQDQSDTKLFLAVLRQLLGFTYLEFFSKDRRFNKLRIYIMCGGGFQRSVAIAEHIAEWITDSTTFPVQIRHLRLEKDQEET